MRNSKTIGFKPLNKVYTNYPNCYFRLTQGVAGSDPGDIADDAGTSIVAAPATATATQWTDKAGWWSGSVANAADCLKLSRADDATNWDKIFNLSGNLVISCRVFADTDPGSAGRIFCLGNLNPNTESQIEVKFLTNGEIDVHVEGDVTAVNLDLLDLPAAAAPNETVIIVHIDGVNDLATAYSYNPASKTLSASESGDISAIGMNKVNASNQEVYIGARMAGGIVSDYVKNLSVRDFRAVNFGTNPPSDLSEIIEEMAINTLYGTRR